MSNVSTINVSDYAAVCDVGLPMMQRLDAACKLYTERRNADDSQRFAPITLPRDVYDRLYAMVNIDDLPKYNILIAGAGELSE